MFGNILKYLTLTIEILLAIYLIFYSFKSTNKKIINIFGNIVLSIGIICFSFVIYEGIFRTPSYALGEERNYVFSISDFLWAILCGTIIPILTEIYFILKIKKKEGNLNVKNRK